MTDRKDFIARASLVAIAESKGFNAPNKASRKYGHYAVNHHTLKFAPAELRQIMAVSGAGPGAEAARLDFRDLLTLEGGK
jgi:hypothetical protein